MSAKDRDRPNACPDACPDAPHVQLEVHLGYRRSHGELTPYFHALVAGRALATRCARCTHTWFPPRVRCCGGDRPAWVELDGAGIIESVTSGTRAVPFSESTGPGRLAMVRMDGADNRALGWLEGFDEEPPLGTRVRIAVTDEPWTHPAQAVRFVAE